MVIVFLFTEEFWLSAGMSIADLVAGMGITFMNEFGTL